MALRGTRCVQPQRSIENCGIGRPLDGTIGVLSCIVKHRTQNRAYLLFTIPNNALALKVFLRIIDFESYHGPELFSEVCPVALPTSGRPAQIRTRQRHIANNKFNVRLCVNI